MNASRRMTSVQRSPRIAMLRAIEHGISARSSWRIRVGKLLRRAAGWGAGRHQAPEDVAEQTDLVAGEPPEEARLDRLEERVLRLGEEDLARVGDRGVDDA